MIETERLILRPLTYEQLIKYIKTDNSLEIELNLAQTSRAIEPELKEALEETILPNVADFNKNYLYSTLWTVILKEQNKMVGDLCFMGEPNIEGEIEIGYGTYPSFRKNGYMTEAVGGMLEWAKNEPNVLKVLASTEQINTNSHGILRKNNFTQIGHNGTIIIWAVKVK
jgi:[ribosomal protein S5]-alanine N-acetyltransferase